MDDIQVGNLGKKLSSSKSSSNDHYACEVQGTNNESSQTQKRHTSEFIHCLDENGLGGGHLLAGEALELGNNPVRQRPLYQFLSQGREG